MRDDNNGLVRFNRTRVIHVRPDTDFNLNGPTTLPNGRQLARPRIYRHVQGGWYREITPAEYARLRRRTAASWRPKVVPRRSPPVPRPCQSRHIRPTSFSGDGDRDDGGGGDPDGGPPPPSSSIRSRVAP
jgi:hypothetical protein